MITNINIRNLTVTDGRELNLNPDSPDGYDVRQVEGLTPTQATIASTTNRFLPGSKITNVKAAVRAITITLEPNPHHNDSAFELRYGLYRHFVTGHKVRLTVEYSNKTARQIDGVVETHEANIFSDEPRTQVTLYCEDPYFKDVEETVVQCGTPVNTSRTTQAYIDVDGDVDTPILLSLYAGTALTASQTVRSVFVDLSSPWNGSTSLRKFRLEGMGTNGLSSGDTLEISSLVGQKRAYKKNGSNETSLLAFLSLTAEWPIVTPGSNRLEIQASVNGTNRNLGYPILRYRTRYSGA